MLVIINRNNREEESDLASVKSIQKRFNKIRWLGIGEGRFWWINKRCRSVENKLTADRQFTDTKKDKFYFRFRKRMVFQTNRESRRNKSYFSCNKTDE